MKTLKAAGILMTDAVRTIHDRYGKMLCMHVGDGNDYIWNVDHINDGTSLLPLYVLLGYC